MEQWWWSLSKQRAEQGPGDPADNRLGPYDSEEQARSWKDRAAARNQEWDDQDARWSGTTPD